MTPCPAVPVGTVRRLSALLIATAVLAACATATPSASRPTAASLTPTAVSSTAPSIEPNSTAGPLGSAAAASLRAAPPAPCQRGATGTACIAPGRYVLDGDLAPARISMDVPAGWFEWDQGRGSEGVLVSGGPDAPDGSGWGLLVASVGQLAVNPCNPSKGLLPATAQVDEIVKAMTSWPGFKASAPQPITIDGSAGALVELTYTKDASTCPSSFLWTTPAGTEIDTYPMVDPSASRPAQFRILSVNGKPVIIRTTDFPEPSPFELSQGVAPNPNRHAADQPVLRAMVDSIELSTP